MQRHLDEGDLQELDQADLRMLLSEQMEEHRRLREQAQRLVSTFLAAGGVTAAVIGYQLYPDIPIPILGLADWGPVIALGPTFQTLVAKTVVVSGHLLILALGLLFFSFMSGINAVRMKGVHPLSRHKELKKSDPSKDRSEGLKSWILKNDERLVETEKVVQQAYTLIHASISCLVLIIVVAVGVLGGSINYLGIAHLGLILLIPAFLLLNARRSLCVFYGTVRQNGVVTATRAAIPWFYDSLDHRGIGYSAKMASWLVWGAFVTQSWEAVEVWLAHVM